jgi:hypothetical protein
MRPPISNDGEPSNWGLTGQLGSCGRSGSCQQNVSTGELSPELSLRSLASVCTIWPWAVLPTAPPQWWRRFVRTTP